MSFVIPAIDLLDNKCVRLQEGRFESSTIFRDDPIEFSKELEDAGFSKLHLVDLDGAKAGYPSSNKLERRFFWRIKEGAQH